jgi:hypothetical protein
VTFSGDSACCLIPGSNSIFITGGKDERRNALATCGVFDLGSLEYNAVTDMPEAKFNHAVVWYDGRGYIFGGKDASVMRSQANYMFVENEWQQIANHEHAEGDTTACVFRDAIYIAASYNFSIERYDPASNTWTLILNVKTCWHCGP